MQDELRTNYPELDIEILGVNGVPYEPGNADTTDGRDLPWLQDVDDAVEDMSAMDAWGATLRDVIILDTNNAIVGRYNLTANDLANSANYDELRDLFVEIATAPTDPSSLSGYVYFDVNNNGLMDESESTIGNVEITLTGDSGQQTVMTEADGSYAFYGLGAGTYTITQSQPAMVADGADSLGSAGGTVGDDQFTVELAAGEQGTDYNFGERGRKASTIRLVDLLASPSDPGMVAVMEVSSDGHWYCLQGEWAEYQYAHVELADSDPTVATVSTRDIHGHDFEGVFDTDEASGAYALAVDDTHTMLRFDGPLIDITEAANAMAEGESVVAALGAPAPEVNPPAPIAEGESDTEQDDSRAASDGDSYFSPVFATKRERVEAILAMSGDQDNALVGSPSAVDEIMTEPDWMNQ